jgi:DEAD/DEAH box helicase domain-containing protein
MNLQQLLDQLRESADFRSGVTAWKVIPSRPACYGTTPPALDQRLLAALRSTQIERLYTHQVDSFEKVQHGKHIVVVTPTASGKTLCYNLPVLDRILSEPAARALYVFPTKALTQDQMHELHDLVTLLGADIKTYGFDGDTPHDARKAIRTAGHIVLTNPDMLHTGILPHHTRWIRLFENLRYVVIDEIHHYRGVFGSHLANVLRRLKRICRFYGSQPQFIFCSATIANPLELATKIGEEDFEIVDSNGAPSGEKHLILYNPPVVNRELGIRRGLIPETARIASHFLENEIQSIVFARSRLSVEVLLTYLREGQQKRRRSPGEVRGYRGGYLPLERREIERGLREGEVLGVVSTNALELGIDIGRLDACVLAGYPGSISSTWQQMGRAGRRVGVSAAVFVASSAPLDQYLVNHPEYFLDQSPEAGAVDPDNLTILGSHIKCAAFELPFRDGEQFGVGATGDILAHLEGHGILHHVEGQWHWTGEVYPAEEVSLRTADPENVVIVDTGNKHRVVGEVDHHSAPLLVHQDAIYLHGGVQYFIERLDWKEKRAYARQVDLDYYTDAESKTQIKVLKISEEEACRGGRKAHGEVSVITLAALFKKIKFHTHENVGSGRIHLPEQEMQTTSFWLEFEEPVGSGIEGDEAIAAGLRALANVLVNIVPLFLLCDVRDIRAVPMRRAPTSGRPTIFLYDNHPGGVGFSRRIYHQCQELLEACRRLIESCSCRDGCPSCVGPPLEVEPHGKRAALRLLELATSR